MLLSDWLNYRRYQGRDFGYDVGAWERANPGKRYLDELSRGHLPDTYKTPEHPTFSNQSIYHSDATPGGIWTDDGASFIPSRWQIAKHGLDKIKAYMQWADPNVKVITPDEQEYNNNQTKVRLWEQ